MRRGLVLAIAGCLVSGTLLLLAIGRAWRVFDLTPGIRRSIVGHTVAGSLRAWGIVALAGVVAVVATRGWARLPVGLVLAASGATAAAVAWRERHVGGPVSFITTEPVATFVRSRVTVWPYVAFAAGLLLAATGVLVAIAGPRWSALGARYDAPVPAPTETDLWTAQDRGEDPTATIHE